jgi:ubiquinone biosynthesis protein UbiJ
MVAIRTDVRAIKTGFDDIKMAITAELATLSSSMSDTERSLTVRSDDVDVLKREVNTLQNKCKDQGTHL